MSCERGMSPHHLRERNNLTCAWGSPASPVDGDSQRGRKSKCNEKRGIHSNGINE